MESLRPPTRRLLSQFAAQSHIRWLSRITSSKNAASRSSVLGKRRRDTRTIDRGTSKSRPNDRALGVRRTEGHKEGSWKEAPSANRTEGPGYMAERRKMAAEFAEMRREEKQLFPPPGSQLNNPKPKLSHSARSSQTSHTPFASSKIHSVTSSKEPVSSTPKSKFSSKSPKQTFQLSTTKSLHIPILLEHPDFICINKSPSVLSQPGLPGEGTILTLLEYQRPDLTLQTVNRYSPSPSVQISLPFPLFDLHFVVP